MDLRPFNGRTKSDSPPGSEKARPLAPCGDKKESPSRNTVQTRRWSGKCTRTSNRFPLYVDDILQHVSGVVHAFVHTVRAAEGGDVLQQVGAGLASLVDER